MNEYTCQTCGETFVDFPDEDEVVIHLFKEDETECGGTGELQGTVIW